MKHIYSRSLVFTLSLLFALQPLGAIAQSQARERQDNKPTKIVRDTKTDSADGADGRKPLEGANQIVRAADLAADPSQALMDAVLFFSEEFHKEGTIWDFLRSSNTFREVLAGDEIMTAEEKVQCANAIATAESWNPQKGDKEVVLECVDALFAGESYKTINTIAWFIVKEGKIKSDLSGNAPLLEQAIKKLNTVNPLDPIYLAQISKKYLNELSEVKQDLISWQEKAKEKKGLANAVNGKDDKTKGTAPIGAKAEEAIANAKKGKSNAESMRACFDSYMGSGGGGMPFGGGSGGGEGDPLGTTTPDGGTNKGGGNLPGPKKSSSSDFSSAMGGFDLNKWEKGGGEKGDGSEGNCYGLDMGKFLNKASDGGADEGTSPSSGNEAFDKYQKQVSEVYNNVVGANKGTEVSSGYTVSTAVQPSGSGVIHATTQTATVTAAPGGMSYNVTYTNQTMTSSNNGETWTPGSTTANTMTGQSGAAISASFKGALTNAAHSVVTGTLEKNGGSGGGKYGNATVVVSNGSGKTNSWNFMPANEDTGSDSPCDGEKDHTAFAECVGTPGTGGGLGLAHANAGLPNCSDYFSENGRPSPVADGDNINCSSGGCNGGGGNSGGKEGPFCQGDSNALILYATNPNIPLWDPQPMMESQQKSTPAVMKVNQSKTQSATQQKTTKQAVSPTPTGKQGAQSKPSEKDGSNASSGKLPLKPVGGAKPGSAPGTPPPPKPKPGI